MGKYLSIGIGAIVLIIGILCLAAWRSDFIIMLKGTIPGILILCGLIAGIAGISELKDEAASKKEEKK